MIVPVVMTKTRPEGIGYLNETLTNFVRSNKRDHPIVVMSGDNCTRLQNAARTLARGIDLAKEFNSQWVLMLEDDLDFCDDFMGSVERWLFEYGTADVPLFALAQALEWVSHAQFPPGIDNLEDEKFNASKAAEAGVKLPAAFPHANHFIKRGDSCIAQPIGSFWGAQAIVWRRDKAEKLVDWLGDDPVFDDGKEVHRMRGWDILLQKWMLDAEAQGKSYTMFATAIPSFVQHIGRSSNLSTDAHKQPFFQFPWPGREWKF